MAAAPANEVLGAAAPTNWGTWDATRVRADDTAKILRPGSTQYAALGHVGYVGYVGKLSNGDDAPGTIGPMDQASVLPIAENGVVGRGVLIDLARPRGQQFLAAGETFDHTDLQTVAAAQYVTNGLAGAGAADARWSLRPAAAPSTVVDGTGAPVNPIAIR